MNDNLELAKRVWADILMIDICLVLPAEAIPIITTALEARYKAGMKAMRDAAHPLMRWPEDHEGLDAVFARLLEAK